MSSLVPLCKLAAQLHNAEVCDVCGKSRVVVNMAYRGYRAERVTPATHCACVGGPAYIKPAHQVKPTTCDVCDETAVALVRNDEQRYHSFRCGPHLERVVDEFRICGLSALVEPMLGVVA